ncbi:MAG: hypothetical protein AAGI23_16055 [Bacteroidota bacterium]
MRRHINLQQKKLKQLKTPAFAKRTVLRMPKKNLTPTANKAIVNIQKSNSVDGMTFKGRAVAQWVSLRILQFLNQAQSVEDLTNVEEESNNYSIGATVAARILSRRSSLPRKRFSTLAELEGIAGFGEDKLNDLVILLSQRANDGFRTALFDGLLMSNWIIKPYRIEVKDDETWAKVTQSTTWRQLWLTEELGQLSELLTDTDNSERAKQYMRTAYVETFQEEEIASYAFALCWYQIDMDNWFSFNTILSKVRDYLSYYSHPSYGLTLLLVKGFPMELLGTNGVSTTDLPIILNTAERSVTVWTIELLD